MPMQGKMMSKGDIIKRCREANVLRVVATLFDEPEAICRIYKKHMNADLRLPNG